ncbi:MAG: MEKHLA domain-containing protein [Gammaproteobacteria bacterium]|nr:MEKHLA domain-containing protein [Gammaproteobacteria bacterium]
MTSDVLHLCPGDKNNYLSGHIRLLRDSYKTLTGKDIVNDALNDIQTAKVIYYSTSIVLSHDTQSDPILNYANQAGLELFNMEWEQMLTTPSRLTAESMEQEERQRLLDKVSTQGYIDDYSGVRITTKGRRFKIERATVWNLVDPSGVYKGQAAMFSDYTYLD